jgi:translocation and assembly module TamB
MAETTDRPGTKLLIWRWSMRSLLGLVAIVMLGLVGAAMWLDSDSGHRFIIDQVEALEPEDGLRIRIADIEGSIYGEGKVQWRSTGIRWPGYSTNFIFPTR